MLFTYNFIEYPFGKIQAAIDELFCEIWCGNSTENFEECLNKNERVQELFNCMRFKCTTVGAQGAYTKGGKQFYDLAEVIHEKFKNISYVKKSELKSAYTISQNIEKCLDGRVVPLSKESIEESFPDGASDLEKFFKMLWEKRFWRNKVAKERYGDLQNHYKKFIESNNNGVCAYCGLDRFYNVDDKKREAYDHFLPLSKYYFSAVNLKNLTPMCHKCNSDFKKANDPLFKDANNRRKVVFPYLDDYTEILINIRFPQLDLSETKSEDLNIEFTSSISREYIESWDEIFNIKSRYANIIASESLEPLKDLANEVGDNMLLSDCTIQKLKNEEETLMKFKKNFLDVACIKSYRKSLENIKNSGLFP